MNGQTASVTSDQTPYRRVLLVEDDAGTRLLLTRLIQREQIAISCAATGEEALTLLTQAGAEAFDLLVSDYNLPDMTCGQLVERLRADALSIPFMVITGAGSELVAVDMMKAGARDYMVKDAGFLDRAPVVIQRVLMDLETERRMHEAEAQLRRTATLLQVVFDSTREAILLLDAEMRVLRANQAAGEPSGSPWLLPDLFQASSRPQVLELFQTALRGETPPLAVAERLTTAGAVRWVEVAMAPLPPTATEYCVVMVLRDVTDRIQTEREREAMLARLMEKRQLESLGVLAAGVGHEINNPLTGVLNYAQLIADLSPDGTVIQSYADEVVKGSERIAAIVRQLVDFTRDDEHNRTTVRLDMVVQQVLGLMGATLERSGIFVFVQTPESLPAVWCNQHQMRLVLLSIVENAREALERRFPQADPAKRLRILASERNDNARQMVRLTVEDSGDGIPDDVLPHLFEPFFTTKSRAVADGLDLAIAYRVIEAHGGMLSVETQVGRGTAIHIDLPVASRAEGDGYRL